MRGDSGHHVVAETLVVALGATAVLAVLPAGGATLSAFTSLTDALTAAGLTAP